MLALPMLLLSCVAGDYQDGKSRPVAVRGEESACMYPLLRERLPDECEELPAEYGTVAKLPLEWGYLGIAGPGGPNGGRVICPGGGTPRTTRLGSIATPPEYKTTAPPSMTNREGKGDILDAWTVRCPDEPQPRTWFFNLYRCGAPCMPRGFHLMDAEAVALYRQSVKDMEAKDYASSLEQAREAHALEPTSESINARLATAYLLNHQPAQALAHFERAATSSPKNPYHRLHAAIARLDLGDGGSYRKTVEQLVAALPPEHALMNELQCRQANALKRDGEMERAKALAASSCTAGEKHCCWKQ